MSETASAATSAAPAILPRAKDLPAASPRAWHWPEYGAELAGTVWNVFAGLSAVVFNFAPGLPGSQWMPDPHVRLWVTGLVFAGSGSLYTISPWGRLSGAHLNPAVTLAFTAVGKLRWHDTLAYLAAQFAGGTLAAALLTLVWGGHFAAAGSGVTHPGPGYTVADAFWTEWWMTFSYLLAIFFFVSQRSLMRWTPLMNWAFVTALVRYGAEVSGTSLNPARSLGPALVSGLWQSQWIYAVAPTAGALLAAGAWRLIGKRKVLTAKLYHVEFYRSIFRRLHVPCKQQEKSESAIF